MVEKVTILNIFVPGSCYRFQTQCCPFLGVRGCFTVSHRANAYFFTTLQNRLRTNKGFGFDYIKAGSRFTAHQKVIRFKPLVFFSFARLKHAYPGVLIDFVIHTFLEGFVSAGVSVIVLIK